MNEVINVGDTVYNRLRIGKALTRVAYKGTVLYVHPQRRFYRAEYQLPAGSIIESFIIMPAPRKRIVEEKHKRPKLAEINRNRWKK